MLAEIGVKGVKLVTGADLAPRKPGRKPKTSKQVYCPRIPAKKYFPGK